MDPKKIESLWSATTPQTDFAVLNHKLETDVVIIGGGIAGLNAAYFLKSKGLKVIVIEATYIASGTSGNTTSKVTSQHELKYAFIKKHFGKEKAQIYADSNQWAIAELKKIIEKEKIECDFNILPSYTYSRTVSGIEEIKNEVEIAKQLKLPASFVSSIDGFPFEIKGAIRFENQAYFHPRKYLLAIARKINIGGSYIFEKTTAINIQEKDEFCELVTDKKHIKAKYAIVATNFPFYDKSGLFKQIPQIRSYVLAVTTKTKNLQGMFIGTNESDISFRPHKSGNKEWLLVGGVHHPAEDSGDPNDHYRKLERYASLYFDLKSIDYKWAAQDSMSLDKVPYIGRMPNSKRVFVTTGYGAWGMTTGFVSAKILTDLITGAENYWKNFYDPTRIMQQTNNVVKLKSDKQNGGDFMDLKNDEGKVINQKGEQLAVYKDKTGKISAHSAVCTHMGCIVGWNGGEKTWDCPCHGSRYGKNGKVINGPAVKDLPVKELALEK